MRNILYVYRAFTFFPFLNLQHNILYEYYKPVLFLANVDTL